MDLKSKYDVVVVGGGPGGVGAAVAAAKEGASTLLIERYGFLGGMATAGMVNPFMKYTCNEEILTSDSFNEVIDRMKDKGALDESGQIFDDEVLKFVLDEMMQTYNVDVLLHSFLVDAHVVNNSIESIEVAGKSGLMNISAEIFIDCTGDGDLAARAGAAYKLGRDKDGACQPMTLCFRLANVTGNLDCSTLHHELTKIYKKAKADGQINNPREDVLLFRTLQQDTYHFNTTRVIRKLGTSSFDLTDAEIEARRQTAELLDLFKQHSPYFKNAYLVKTACQIGVRETRRVTGMYELTEEDVLAARKFADGVAKSNYCVDIHNPSGTGTVLKHVPANDFYEIPYRCLVPQKISNLLLGSRCISATHEAHSSLRIMPVVACIGEAAGIAAAWAVRYGLLPKDIDGREIKRAIFGLVDAEDSRGVRSEK